MFTRILILPTALLTIIYFFSFQSNGQSIGDTGYLLYNVNIVNANDNNLTQHHALMIQGNKILTTGKYKSLKKKYPAATIIDCNEKFLIPGLWDMHIHLEGAELIEDNEALLPVFLAYGITTVRDCASDLGLQVLKWRDEIKSGKRIGPKIYTAGRKLEGKNSIWKGDLEIENETELNSMLDTLDRDKVDFVKITENTLQGDLFLKSVKAAHARGYRVSGHVPVDVTINELVEAGYTSVEHASYLLRLGGDENKIQSELHAGEITKGEAEARYVSTFDQTRAIEEYKKLGKKGLFVCPTLIGSYQLAYLKETDHSNDEFLRYLSEKFVSNYQWRIQRMANETPDQLQQRKDRLELLKKQLPLMQSAGIQLMAGSDAAALNTYVYPAESLLQELELFQEAGLSPSQILQSATMMGPRYFGIQNQAGTIESDMIADLVLLNENPLVNIRALRSVNSVVAGGKLYNRNDLDRFLEEAHQKKLLLDKRR
jgi:imidazolonepropionase-like amidohydrolase